MSDLLAEPIGHYVIGRSFVAWVQSPHRLGVFHFAPLDAADGLPLAALCALPSHASLASRFDLLHEVGEIESADMRESELFTRYLVGWAEALVGRTRRVAVVCRPGLLGAALAGLLLDRAVLRRCTLLGAPRAEALAWLGVEGGAAAALHALCKDCVQPGLVRRLRAQLEGDLVNANLERAAEALALTPRSLQRHLARYDTSFRAERQRAQLRAAERLLRGSDAKVEAVARAVGFRSAAAFSAMHRLAEGESPSEVRRRRQASRG